MKKQKRKSIKKSRKLKNMNKSRNKKEFKKKNYFNSFKEKSPLCFLICSITMFLSIVSIFIFLANSNFDETKIKFQITDSIKFDLEAKKKYFGGSQSNSNN